MTEKSGADILIEAFNDLGVEVIFGYPGGAVLPIYDAIFQQTKIRHILVRHEQAATHAAEGYARATGKPGVVLVTSGPGATNLVTPIADAYMDSVPLVCITGQVFSHLMGTDAFQEADIEKKPILFLYSHRGEYMFCDPKDRAKRFPIKEEVIGEVFDGSDR